MSGVLFEVEYDGNLDGTLFRCVNASAPPVEAWIRLSLANGRSIERTFGPGTTEVQIPTSVAARLRFVVNASRGNRLENLNTEIEVPPTPDRPPIGVTLRNG